VLVPRPIELAVNVLLILVVPTTFRDDTKVVTPCKVVFPDTFNEDIKVVIPCKVVFPETFNELVNVTEFLSVANPYVVKLPSTSKLDEIVNNPLETTLPLPSISNIVPVSLSTALNILAFPTLFISNAVKLDPDVIKI
jgi:hypothetical protein